MGSTSGLLAEVWRGERMESLHYGRVAVVDSRGRVLWSCGDIERPVYPRSTVKALLAIALVESGAAERLGLPHEALALACASHGGEPGHTAIAARMLARVGRTVGALECGTHWPTHDPSARALAAAGEAACPLHNNCSGKHAGLVCLSCDAGQDPSGYIDPSHPVQQRVTRVLEEMTNARHAEENGAVDGCSMPTYAIPLVALARGYASFGSGVGLSADRQKATQILRQAVAEHPFVVAGTGRYDTTLMDALGLRAFVKMGAEGVMVASLPDEGLGIAIKTDDGANRAAEVAMSALIARFGGRAVCAHAEGDGVLCKTSRHVLRNWQEKTVGAICAAKVLRG